MVVVGWAQADGFWPGSLRWVRKTAHESATTLRAAPSIKVRLRAFTKPVNSMTVLSQSRRVPVPSGLRGIDVSIVSPAPIPFPFTRIRAEDGRSVSRMSKVICMLPVRNENFGRTRHSRCLGSSRSTFSSPGSVFAVTRRSVISSNTVSIGCSKCSEPEKFMSWVLSLSERISRGSSEVRDIGKFTGGFADGVFPFEQLGEEVEFAGDEGFARSLGHLKRDRVAAEADDAGDEVDRHRQPMVAFDGGCQLLENITRQADAGHA